MKKNTKKIVSLVAALTLVLGGVGVYKVLAEANDKAFEYAGVNKENVRDLEVEKDFEHGVEVYEVNFESEGYEYDYEVDAKTGEVLQSYKEVDDDYVVQNVKEPVEKADPADIGKEKAKSVALANAGLKESQVSRLEVERDMDDGRLEYSVEFKANGKEYDYEISAETGKILDYDVDVEDND